jgi:hypothetical protein
MWNESRMRMSFLLTVLGLTALACLQVSAAQPAAAPMREHSPQAAASGKCERGSYCLFMRRGYRGNGIESNYCCGWLNLSGKANNNVSSVKNKTEARLFLASGKRGKGKEVCFNPFSATSSLGGFDNRASSFRRAKVLGPHCH